MVSPQGPVLGTFLFIILHSKTLQESSTLNKVIIINLCFYDIAASGLEACILSGLPRDPGNPAGITGYRIHCFINPVIGTGRELIPTGPVGSGNETILPVNSFIPDPAPAGAGMKWLNELANELVALPTKEQKHPYL